MKRVQRKRTKGFLFPTNELELARFDKLYADYDFKLKDVSIDAKSIVEGKICSCGTKVLHIEKTDELCSKNFGIK